MKVISDTYYQPRLLDNPDDPMNSEWELAVYEPDVDDQAFPNYDLAVEAGINYLEASGSESEADRLVIVCITVTSIPIPVDAGV